MLRSTAPRLKATVSGSFHRHMQSVYEAVGELRARNIDVLSPSDPRIVDSLGEFLFVAQMTAIAGGELRLDAVDGPVVSLLPLPYALPEATAPRGRIA